jgi:hypothetical protein
MNEASFRNHRRRARTRPLYWYLVRNGVVSCLSQSPGHRRRGSCRRRLRSTAALRIGPRRLGADAAALVADSSDVGFLWRGSVAPGLGKLQLIVVIVPSFAAYSSGYRGICGRRAQSMKDTDRPIEWRHCDIAPVQDRVPGPRTDIGNCLHPIDA